MSAPSECGVIWITIVSCHSRHANEIRLGSRGFRAEHTPCYAYRVMLGQVCRWVSHRYRGYLELLLMSLGWKRGASRRCLVLKRCWFCVVHQWVLSLHELRLRIEWPCGLPSSLAAAPHWTSRHYHDIRIVILNRCWEMRMDKITLLVRCINLGHMINYRFLLTAT